jgi:hypothetical protein
MRNMSTNTPSVKALRAAFPELSAKQAREIKDIMRGPYRVDGKTRLERIDVILGTHGVEHIAAGFNANSPAIYYCNTGDSYGTTILKIEGERFRIGNWGDYVERGHYA